jgi:uncharacterized protein YeaO (DUF488 family)
MIRVKRAHSPPATGDGVRFLVDRLWPGGIKKQDLRIDGWLKEIAPSDDQRLWFGHDPDRWKEFQRRCFFELDSELEALRPIREAARLGSLTLLYNARDTEHNNAVALKAYLEKEGPVDAGTEV